MFRRTGRLIRVIMRLTLKFLTEGRRRRFRLIILWRGCWRRKCLAMSGVIRRWRLLKRAGSGGRRQTFGRPFLIPVTFMGSVVTVNTRRFLMDVVKLFIFPLSWGSLVILMKPPPTFTTFRFRLITFKRRGLPRVAALTVRRPITRVTFAGRG